MDHDIIRKRWQRTARGRLKFELSGLAFARKHGFSPETYAEHLWGNSAAIKWMGKTAPTAWEYMLKEVEAFHTLYPEVSFQLNQLSDDEPELIFAIGCCLGGWGRNQWGMANRAGLGKSHVCRYCRQAFRVWSDQLSLCALPEPQVNGSCILRVEKITKTKKG